MPDIRTLGQLQNALDKEMSWRQKEIGVFKLEMKRAGPRQKFFVRAAVALLYAHWEGFIKAASEHYLSFVQYQRHTYRELRSCFAVYGLKGRLEELSQSRATNASVEAFDFIVARLDETARLQVSGAIRTESNLKWKVFVNIATSLGLEVDRYMTKANLINTSLVDRRNSIAHGEYLELGGTDVGKLVDEVLQMMRDYKTDIQNAASMGSYKRIDGEA